MPGDATPSTENQPAPLSVSSILARLAGIGGVILLVRRRVSLFGGWFSPHELTPIRFVNGLKRSSEYTPGSAAIMPKACA
jgi:hypothetical protein